MNKKSNKILLLSILIVIGGGFFFYKSKDNIKKEPTNLNQDTAKKQSNTYKTIPLENNPVKKTRDIIKPQQEFKISKVESDEPMVPEECKKDSDLIMKTTIIDLRNMFAEKEINDVFSKECVDSLKGLPWAKIDHCKQNASVKNTATKSKKKEDAFGHCSQVLLDLKARVLVQNSKNLEVSELNKQELIAHSILSLNNIARGKFPETRDGLLKDISIQKQLFKSFREEDRAIKLNYYSYLNLLKDFGYVDFNEDAINEIKELHDDLGLKTKFPPPKGANFEQSYEFKDF